MLLNQNTNNNYTARQLKLPLEIEKLIDISDPVYTFFVLIPSRYLAKADRRAKPGGAYFLSVGDTVFSPPTTDARLTIQFISLPTFHLEDRRILVFLIKLPSFLKRIFHIYISFFKRETFL